MQKGGKLFKSVSQKVFKGLCLSSPEQHSFFHPRGWKMFTFEAKSQTRVDEGAYHIQAENGGRTNPNSAWYNYIETVLPPHYWGTCHCSVSDLPNSSLRQTAERVPHTVWMGVCCLDILRERRCRWSLGWTWIETSEEQPPAAAHHASWPSTGPSQHGENQLLGPRYQHVILQSERKKIHTE